MNAGIATFHQVYNYGAKLQQCALFKTIEKMGHTAYVLDFTDEGSESLYHPRWRDLLQFNLEFWSYARMIARDTVEFSLKPFKHNIFRAFMKKHLRMGIPPGDSGAPIYDALICGSDQVWNPQLTCGDPRFFLRFESPATKVRIAYAPSFGAQDQVPESFLPTLSEYLKDIDILSCREQEGCALVEQLTHRPCPRIADPVMLLSAKDWAKLAQPPRGAPVGNYIFCFDMEYHSPLLQYAARAAAARAGGAPVYYLEGFLGKKGWRSAVGPAEFIWLIQHAQSVVTNSFHGTVCSLLFKKPLRVVYPIGRIARIKELLERFQLTHLLISTRDDASRHAPYDAAKTMALIEQERARGLDFLQCALNGQQS